MKMRSIFASATLAAAAIGIVGCESDGLAPRGSVPKLLLLFLFCSPAIISPPPQPAPLCTDPSTSLSSSPARSALPQEMIDQMQSHKELFARVDSLPGAFDFSPSETDSMSNPRSYTEFQLPSGIRPSADSARFDRPHLTFNPNTSCSSAALSITPTTQPRSSASISQLSGAFVVPSQTIYATGRARTPHRRPDGPGHLHRHRRRQTPNHRPIDQRTRQRGAARRINSLRPRQEPHHQTARTYAGDEKLKMTHTAHRLQQ